MLIFYSNKKGFHSNTNRPLDDRQTGYNVNKFEQVKGRGSCMVRPKLNTFEHVRGGGQSWRLVLYGDLPLNGQTERHDYKHYLHQSLISLRFSNPCSFGGQFC